MFVIAGVTGNTGRIVAETLLARGKSVRVLVRDAAKAEALRAQGAEVVVARLDDATALTAALRGAEGAYLLLPPDYASTDTVGDKRRLVDVFAAAIPASGVKHVVLLSSIGAQHATGTGIIRTLHDAETRLAASAPAVTFLRAAYFAENWGAVLGPVKEQGVLPAMFAPGKRIPMVATEDIGRVAAEALLEAPRAGASPQVIELSGPVDASAEDVAAALGVVLGKAPTVVHVPPEGVLPALTSAGLNPDVAGLFAEMNAGIDAGRVAFQGAGARSVRGRVGLEATLKKLLGR